MKYLDIILLIGGAVLAAFLFASGQSSAGWIAAFIPLAVAVYHGCNQFEIFGLRV